MPELGRTWMVLLRDVSHAVHVVGEDRIMAALVLHAETGLVLGVSISGTAAEALSGAFDAALTNQAADLPPAPPARVVSLVEVAPDVRKAVAAASFGSPQLIEAGSFAEAEDIFDSLVGHMAGRAQPADPPSTEDWSLLVGQAIAYLRAEPWVRWSDVVPLGLQLTVDGTSANYVAIVMGNAGVQRGLALYPGMTLPLALRSPGTAPALEATPSGTLLLMLDAPGEVPDEFAEKALRSAGRLARHTSRPWSAWDRTDPATSPARTPNGCRWRWRLCSPSTPEVRFWPRAPGRRRDGWHSPTGPMGTS